MSQFEPQSAGLGPNGKYGSMYGGMCNFISFQSLLTQAKHMYSMTLKFFFSCVTGMGGLPYGGQTMGMGAEKPNPKYGECLLVVFYQYTITYKLYVLFTAL